MTAKTIALCFFAALAFAMPDDGQPSGQAPEDKLLLQEEAEYDMLVRERIEVLLQIEAVKQPVSTGDRNRSSRTGDDAKAKTLEERFEKVDQRCAMYRVALPAAANAVEAIAKERLKAGKIDKARYEHLVALAGRLREKAKADTFSARERWKLWSGKE